MTPIQHFESEHPCRRNVVLVMMVWLAAAIIAMHIAILSLAAVTTTWNEFGLQDDVVPLEGEIIYLARRAQRSEPVYLDYRTIPFVPAAYGPLAYYAIGWIGRWGNSDALGLYTIGRAMSLAASVGTVILLWIATPPMANRWKYLSKLLAVGVFLVGMCPFEIGGGSLVPMHMAATARPDASGVLLGLAGCLLASRGRALWAVPFFVTATLFKHVYVAGAVATLMWLFLRGEKRNFKNFAVAWAAAEAVVWSLVVGLCGRPLLLNLTMFGHVPWAWDTAPMNLWGLRATFAIPLAAAVLHWHAQARTRTWDIPAVYALLTFLAGFVTISKVGGACNHFLEFVVAAAWCAGVSAARLSATWRGQTYAARTAQHDDDGTESHATGRRVVLAPVVCFLAAGLVSVYSSRHTYQVYIQKAPQRLSELAGWHSGASDSNAVIPEAVFYQMVLAGRFRGPLLTSDARLSALSDKEPIALDWLIWATLVEQGIVDLEPVLARVRAHEFELVVLHFDPSWPTQIAWGAPAWPPRLTETIRDHYVLKQVIGRFHILWPKSPNDTNYPTTTGTK